MVGGADRENGRRAPADRRRAPRPYARPALAAVTVVVVFGVGGAFGACGGDFAGDVADGALAGDALSEGFSGDDSDAPSGLDALADASGDDTARDGALIDSTADVDADGAARDAVAADSPSDAAARVECGTGAAPGTLDTMFADAGIASLYAPGGVAYAVATDAAGAVLVGGNVAAHAVVAKLLRDGTIDPNFGVGGKLESSPGDFANAVQALAIQADGKIIAAGTARFSNRPSDFFVERLLPDGHLDSGFGASGTSLTDFAGRDDNARSVIVEADGHILVGGITTSGGVQSTTDYAVVRYNEDGSIDTSFGTGGKYTADVHGTADYFGGFAILPGGGLAIAGASAQSTSLVSANDISAVMLATTSSTVPASSFGDAGVFVATVDPAPVYPSINGILADVSGGFLLCGNFPGVGTDFGLVRVTATGAIDTSFGNSGLLLTDFQGRSDSCEALARTAGGEIVAAGMSTVGSGTSNIAVSRYAAGVLDLSFGNQGRVLVPPPPNADYSVYSATVDVCGELVIAGSWLTNENSVAQSAMGVARFHL